MNTKMNYFTQSKKWWALAIVLTLALSLTSCSKSNRTLTSDVYGYSRCLGSLGDFDVFVVPSEGVAGSYNLVVIPIQPIQEGVVIRVAIANNNSDIVEKVSQVSAASNQEINAGFISETDIQNYDLVAMTSYRPGTPFLGGNANDPFAVCELPLPGGTVAGAGN